MIKKYFKKVSSKPAGHIWIDDLEPYEYLDLQAVGTLPADHIDDAGLIFHSKYNEREYLISIKDLN